MEKYKNLPYRAKVQWRIRCLKVLIVVMIIYMVFIAEMGGGDSRIMTQTAQNISRLLFFGGLLYIICKIRANKKLLNNMQLLKEQMTNEQDERNQYLYDKSGGIVVNILLMVLLFTTFTASLFNMSVFYLSLSILLIIIVLKSTAYYIYKRHW